MSCETEIWKNIEGYDGLYQVSNYGRVKKFSKKGRFLRYIKPYFSRGGYLCLNITYNSITTRFYVHRLVYKEFIGKLIKGLEIDHIDNIKSNNHTSNLQQITTRLNSSKDIKNTASQFTGVSRKGKSWRALIRINGKRIYLGQFKNELDAHNAYQNAIPKKEREVLSTV
jgi:hypothetical protein